MRVELHTIWMRNFFSIGDNAEEIRLDEDDITMIVGKNGHGKSIILDGICFALYGKPFRKRIKQGQIVNSFNKKACVVEIEFSVGGSHYLVRRGLKPNIFEIYKDAELVKQESDVASYQKYLQKDVLGMSLKTFCQVNIVGKASYVPFMSLEPADRREVIEDLLDSKVYGKMLLIAKEDLKTVDAEIKDAQSKISVLQERISAHEMLMARRNSDLEDQIKNRQDALEAKKQEYREIVAAYKEVSEKYEAMLAEYDALEFSPDAAREAYEELRVQERTLTTDINRYKSVINNVSDVDNCPTCLQAVGVDHKEHVKTEYQEQIAVAERNLAKVQKRKAKLENYLAEVKVMEGEIKGLKQEVDSLAYKGKTIKGVIGDIEVQIADLETKAQDNVSVDLEAFEKTKAELDAQIEIFDEKTKESQRLKSAISLLGDNGIKARLISKYIPIINKKINKYLEIMDLFVEFELDEQFNETIRARYRDNYSYESFSEGQKLRIDLAIMLTWRDIAAMRNSASSNLLFMDEILDSSLDEEGIEDFLKILREISKTCNVFIISHRQSTIDGVDNIIQAKLVKNFTEYTKV